MDKKPLTVTVVLILALLAAAAGARYQGGEWLAAITVPGWTPSAWVFVAGWTVWYAAWSLLALAVAFGAAGVPLKGAAAWLAGLATVVVWNWFLFGLHRPGWSAGVLAVTLAIAALALLRGGRWNRLAALPAVVALAWLGYAWCWNVAVWRLNGGGLDSLFG